MHIETGLKRGLDVNGRQTRLYTVSHWLERKMQAKTNRVKYAVTYMEENTNMNEHVRIAVKLNNKNISVATVA